MYYNSKSESECENGDEINDVGLLVVCAKMYTPSALVRLYVTKGVKSKGRTRVKTSSHCELKLDKVRV